MIHSFSWYFADMKRMLISERPCYMQFVFTILPMLLNVCHYSWDSSLIHNCEEVRFGMQKFLIAEHCLWKKKTKNKTHNNIYILSFPSLEIAVYI